MTFNIQSNEGYTFKGIFQFISSNQQDLVLNVTKDDIYINMDTSEFNGYITLLASRFDMYQCTEDCQITINIAQLLHLCQNIKKKDILNLSVEGDTLYLKVLHFLSSREKVSQMKIYKSNVLEPRTLVNPIPSHNVILKSQEYKNMCRSLSTVNDVFEVNQNGKHLVFKISKSIDPQVYTFGIYDENGVKSVDMFNTYTLFRLSKLSALNQYLYIYLDKPVLHINIHIGDIPLGMLTLNIYSITYLSNEKLTHLPNY